ncbi:hypothetical protein N7505_007308, partial [Penicillium chrysogenum]
KKDLSYLVPEDTFFSSPFPSSQPSFNTTLDNSSVPQRLALPAPEALRRIKADRINEYVLCEANMSKEFVEWWLQTDYRRKKRINWDRRHHATCWDRFDQGQSAPAQVLTQSTWEQKLLNLVIVSHLPFLFLEYKEFYDLISYARLAPTTSAIPSRKVIRTRLREFATENQTTALRSLPPDATLSLALNC